MSFKRDLLIHYGLLLLLEKKTLLEAIAAMKKLSRKTTEEIKQAVRDKVMSGRSLLDKKEGA